MGIAMYLIVTWRVCRMKCTTNFPQLTGVSKSTACEVIHRVSKAIASHKDEFICMPTRTEMQELANRAFEEFSIPG